MNINEEVQMPEVGTPGNLPEKLSPTLKTVDFPNTVKHAQSADIKPNGMAKLIMIAYENGDGNLSPTEIVAKYGHMLNASGTTTYDATLPPEFLETANKLIEMHNHPAFSQRNKSAFKGHLKTGLNLKTITMTPQQKPSVA